MDPWLSLVRNGIFCANRQLKYKVLEDIVDNMALWLTRASGFHICNMFCAMLALSQFIMQPL